MRYLINVLIVAGLFSDSILTKFIHGARIFPSPHALPWEHIGCGSELECFALALIVALLFRNLLVPKNIRPTTPARSTPRITTTTPALACPARYALYEESCGRFCYRYESSLCRSWANARADCQTEGGDLFVPSECNYQFFRVRAQPNEGRCETNFWLGAVKSANEDEFNTVNGGLISNIANFWYPGQPDNAGFIEECLEMRKEFDNFLANDNVCSNLQGYICTIMI